MAGTREGGARAAATNIGKYGEDFYKRIGSLGGQRKVPKGFALMDKEKVSLAGQKGGSISRKHREDRVEAGVRKSWLSKLKGV